MLSNTGDASERMALWTRNSTPFEERRMMSALGFEKGGTLSGTFDMVDVELWMCRMKLLALDTVWVAQVSDRVCLCFLWTWWQIHTPPRRAGRVSDEPPRTCQTPHRFTHPTYPTRVAMTCWTE